MSVYRTTIQDVMESGYRFRVTEQRETVEGLADDLLDEARAGAEQRMSDGQDLLLRELRTTLGYPGGGEPSRTNEPPRYQSGDLHDSWKKSKPRWIKKGLILRGSLYSRHPAAGPLEFGALRALGIAPRPYYRPTLARIATWLEITLMDWS
jgi:hypothetical protein